MTEKHYIIQYKFQDWMKWENYPTEYATLEEAKDALRKKKGIPAYMRIAESYTVVRYKAVKL